MSHIFRITSCLNLLLLTVKCVYIETNFYLHLNQICLNRETNIITQFSDNSLIKLYFDKIKCNAFLFNINNLNQKLDDKLKLLQEKHFNLFIELNNEKELNLLIDKMMTYLLSIKSNIIIILNSKSMSDVVIQIFKSFVSFRCYVIRHENNLNSTEIAYIRPIVNNCHSFNGILYSSEIEVKSMLTAKPSQCNLNGTVLRVVVNKVNNNNYYLFVYKILSFNLRIKNSV